jgi:hypothetical protein
MDEHLIGQRTSELRTCPEIYVWQTPARPLLLRRKATCSAGFRVRAVRSFAAAFAPARSVLTLCYSFEMVDALMAMRPE